MKPPLTNKENVKQQQNNKMRNLSIISLKTVCGASISGLYSKVKSNYANKLLAGEYKQETRTKDETVIMLLLLEKFVNFEFFTRPTLVSCLLISLRKHFTLGASAKFANLHKIDICTMSRERPVHGNVC